MSKIYVKDEKGRYKLVDRDQREETKLSGSSAEKQVSLEELDARLRKVESIVKGSQK